MKKILALLLLGLQNHKEQEKRIIEFLIGEKTLEKMSLTILSKVEIRLFHIQEKVQDQNSLEGFRLYEPEMREIENNLVFFTETEFCPDSSLRKKIEFFIRQIHECRMSWWQNVLLNQARA